MDGPPGGSWTRWGTGEQGLSGQTALKVTVGDLEKPAADAGEGAAVLHRRQGREGHGEEVIGVRRGALPAGASRQVLLTNDLPRPFPVSSLPLFFYVYLYSTAGGVRPAAGTSTNRFEGRSGAQFSSRMWRLQLAFDLWLSRHHLDSCLLWRRRQAFFGSFLPISCPLRGLLG